MNKFRISLLISMVALAYSGIFAQMEVKGSMQSWVYTWENQAENQQVDFYQGIQLNMGSKQVRNLNLDAYLQVIYRGDPAEWQGRLYNFTAKWKNNSNNFNLKLGRQFLYAGVTNGTIDGVTVHYRPTSKILLKAIAGIEAPFDRDIKLQKWGDHNALGTYASYYASKTFKMDMSYFQRANENETTWRQFGTAINGEIHENLYYTAIYQHNLIKSEYQNMRFRLFYKMNPFGFTVEYNDQKPRIYEDSFFRIFKLYAYRQYRTQVTYDISDYQLGLQSFYTTYENGESDNQLALSFYGKTGNIGLLYQDGYGGKNLGVYGDIRYDINDQIQARAYAGFYNYQRQTVEISEDAISYSLGLNYQLLQNLTLRADLQQASNSYYKNDWRGLFFVNYAFH